MKNASVVDFLIRNNHVLVGNSNFGINVENSSSAATDTGYIYNNEVILFPSRPLLPMQSKSRAAIT